MLDWMRFDFRIESLKSVLAELAVAIETCERRIDDAQQTGDEGFIDAVVDSETALLEDLLGAAFVVCQTYISSVIATVQALHRLAHRSDSTLTTTTTNKVDILRCGNPMHAGTAYTEVQIIDAFANYFKHNEEWRGDWNTLDDRSRRTAEIIMSVGASRGSTGNLRTGSEALGNREYHNTRSFAQTLEQWRRNLSQAYQHECRQLGLK